MNKQLCLAYVTHLAEAPLSKVPNCPLLRRPAEGSSTPTPPPSVIACKCRCYFR